MNIFDLIDEINLICKSKKNICKSVQIQLEKLGLQCAILGISSKYRVGNCCNLVYIDDKQNSNEPGFYIIVGIASLGYNGFGLRYRGFIKKLIDEDVVILKLLDYKFKNEENRKKEKV